MNSSEFFVKEGFCPECNRALDRVNAQHYRCHECGIHLYPRMPLIQVFLGYYTEPDEMGKFYSGGKCMSRVKRP